MGACKDIVGKSVIARIAKVVLPLTLLLTSCRKSFDSLVEQSRLRWKEAVCREPSYIQVVQSPTITVCQELKRPDIWGCYHPETRIIEISKIVPKAKLGQVLVHEMGHSLRQSKSPYHINEATGIMYDFSGSVPDVITKDDINFICQEHPCPCRNPETP